MQIMVCPNCKMRVLPNADGTCPSCHRPLTEPEPVSETAAPPAPMAQVAPPSNQARVGDMVSQAWRLTLDHRRLWVLGFFATISIGGAGLASLLLQPLGWAFYGNFNLTVSQIAVTILYFVGSLVFWIIGMGAAIGIVYEIATAIRQPAEPPLSVSELFQKVRTYFLKVVLMIVLVWSPNIVLMGISYTLMIPMLTLWTADVQAGVVPNFGAFGAIWLLTCCTGLLSILLAALDAVAQRGLVMENLGVVSSLQRAWRLIRQNLGTLITIGIVIVVVGFVAGLVAQLITLPILFFVSQPMTQVARDCALQGGQPAAMMECMSQANNNLSAVGLQVVFVGFYALVSAIPTVFNSALITVAYAELENKPQQKTTA